MADVASRGQLMLVAALTLAVLFVGLALLLNTAIFAENLATRQSGGPTGELTAASAAVDDAVLGSLFHVDVTNDDGAGESSLETELADAAGNWSEVAARQLAADGWVVSVDLRGTTGGTRFVHDDPDRAWTSESSDATWTLYSSVAAADHRWFHLDVSRANLPTMALSDDVATVLDESATVEIDSDQRAGSWRLHLFRANGTENVHVLVGTPGGNLRDAGGSYADHVDDACVARGAWVDVQLLEGTVENTPCESLGFASALAGDLTVRVENATAPDGSTMLAGTYDVLVADTTVGTAPFHDASTSDASPYWTPALTAATVQRTFATGGTNRTSTEAVQARWLGDPSSGDGPVARFEVNDSSDPATGDVRYEVNWQARDAGENLAWVNVTVEDGAEQTFTTRVGGATASGTDVYTCASSCAGSHTITVRARDAAGNTAAAAQSHDADGHNGEVTTS